MKKSLLLVAAASLVAAPSATAATTISAGTFKAKGGYKGTLVAFDGKQDSLTITLYKSSKKSSQSHSYSFDKGVKVTSSSIKGSLGKFGRIDLRLTGAKKVKSKVPKGCSGKAGTTRAGTLVGTFRLKADNNYFKTIKASRLTGANAVAGSKLKCKGSGGDPAKGDGSGDGGDTGEPMLMLNRTDDKGTLSFNATRSNQFVIFTEDRTKTAPATVMHEASASGTGLLLAGGGAEVPGLPKYIGGKGTFTGLAGMPAGSPVVPGVLSGSLTAKFDSIGGMPIAGEAMLLNAG